MEILKYIINEDHKFMTYVYRVVNERKETCTSIEMNSISTKFKPFSFDGSRYVVDRRGPFSKFHDVYRDDVLVATIGKSSAFNYNLKIETLGEVYTIKSKYGFKNISIMNGSTEKGKVSRQTNWFKSRFGVALSDDVDPIVIMIALFIQLAKMKAAMAA